MFSVWGDLNKQPHVAASVGKPSKDGLGATFFYWACGQLLFVRSGVQGQERNWLFQEMHAQEIKESLIY